MRRKTTPAVAIKGAQQRVGLEETSAPPLHYGTAHDGADFAVPGVLIPEIAEVRNSDGIFLLPGAVTRFLSPDGRILPLAPEKEGSRGVLSFDAIGLASLMLSRIEERECDSLDRYVGRFIVLQHTGIAVPDVKAIYEQPIEEAA